MSVPLDCVDILGKPLDQIESVLLAITNTRDDNDGERSRLPNYNGRQIEQRILLQRGFIKFAQ